MPEGDEQDPNRAFLPLRLARKELLDQGHAVFPLNDLYDDHRNGGEKIVISFDAMHVLPKNLNIKYRTRKLVHFFMEAPMVGMRYYTKNYQQKVFEKADTVFVQDVSYIHPRFRTSSKLRRFRFAHGHFGIDNILFENRNRKQLVAINANKGIDLKLSFKRIIRGVNPLNYYSNWLFRERSQWIHYFARKMEIDVYGFGWNKYSIGISHFSSPLENHTWRGTIEGPKFPVLAQYDFCLCFENSSFPGYITEKLFDCFATGTIPIYSGAPDIKQYVPADTFINLLEFNSGDELLDYLKSMDTSTKENYREKMKAYLNNFQEDKFSPLKMADLIFQEVEET